MGIQLKNFIHLLFIEGEMEEIKKEILTAEPKAENISITKLVDNFASGSIYYVEFNITGEPEEDENFYYVLMDKNKNVWLYEDGVDAIQNLKVELDKRLSFRQRISEFTLFELISATIAIIITLVVVLIVFGKTDFNIDEQIASQVLNIFLIIVGFYFGKNVKNN